MTTIPQGIYLIENVGFDSENVGFDSGNPKRVLELKVNLPMPVTQVTCGSYDRGQNQHWSVIKVENGYTFQAASPSYNIFVSEIVFDANVTGSPTERTSFTLRDAGGPGDNKYNIIAEADGKEYVLEALNDSMTPVKLMPLMSNNPRQIWRFVSLMD